jgi:hypothetical protein
MARTDRRESPARDWRYAPLGETKDRERRNFEGWMKVLNVAESVTSEKVLPRVEDSP